MNGICIDVFLIEINKCACRQEKISAHSFYSSFYYFYCFDG